MEPDVSGGPGLDHFPSKGTGPLSMLIGGEGNQTERFESATSATSGSGHWYLSFFADGHFAGPADA